MLDAREEFDQMIWQEPKCGHSSVWYDNWTKMGALYYVIPPSSNLNFSVEEVKELMENDTWNSEKLQQLFPQEVTELIHNDLHCLENTQEWDKPWWMLSNSGKFTVSSAWEEVRQKENSFSLYSYIWIKGIPFKVSFFLWRLLRQRLPIGEILIRIKVVEEAQCYCCNSPQPETIEHVFLSSPVAKKVWKFFADTIGIQITGCQLKVVLHKWWDMDASPKLKPIVQAIPSFIIWQLWKRRNVLKHGENMSFYTTLWEIDRHICLMARCRYPWMANIPSHWPNLVKFLED